MPANYQDQEINDTVTSLVKSEISRPYDSLGTRRTDVTFQDIQEVAASCLLQYRAAPYYLVKLAGQRAGEVYGTVGLSAQALAEALAVLRRRSLPVRDISSLVDARTALFELEGAVGNGAKDATKLNAYVRFGTSVDRFLKSIQDNIKKEGQIIQTPEEARTKLSQLVLELEGLTRDYLNRVTLLAGAIQDYEGLELARIVSTTVIQNSRKMLDKRVAVLSGMSEQERLTVLRDSVLDVLSTKAVVQGFGSFPGLGGDIEATGQLTPFTDAQRPGTPASITVPVQGGVALAYVPPGTATNHVQVWLDGQGFGEFPAVDLYLPVSVYPRIDGLSTGPFYIGYDDHNNDLNVYQDGLLQNHRLVANISLKVDVDAVGNEVTPVLGNLAVGSILFGDSVTFTTGPNAGITRKVYFVNQVVPTGEVISFGLDDAALTTCQDVYCTVPVHIYLTKNTPTTTPRTAVQIVQDLQAGLINTEFTANSFFSPLMFEGEVLTQANQVMPVYGFFQANSVHPGDEIDFYFGPNIGTRTVDTVHLDGDGNIDYFEVLGAPLATVTITTDPTNRARYGAAARALRVEAVDPLDSVLKGLSLELKNETTVPAAPRTLSSIGIPGEFSVQGTVTDLQVCTDYVGKNTTRVKAELIQDIFLVPATATSTAASAMSVQIPYTPVGLENNMALVIPAGQNAGTYMVDSVQHDVGFSTTLKLKSPLPVGTDQYNQPIDLGVVNIGFMGWQVSSTCTTTASALAASLPVEGGGYQAVPPFTSYVYGTTPYVKFSKSPRGLSVGDILNFYDISQNSISQSCRILQIFSDGVVLLDQDISMQDSWDLGVVTVPYCRVLPGKQGDYGTMKAQLDLQLASSQANPTLYFHDLNRLINPLIVNQNPTDLDISQAEQRLQDLTVVLAAMQAAIDAYVPQHVTQVDDLIGTFLAQGADRAVDALLSCRFSAFFGMSQELTSYGGAFQAAVRDVAMNDLPVRKINRAGASLPVLRSTSYEADYETSSQDLDTATRVDPPVSIDQTDR